ncbi:MAG: winged helix-turn-helix domain-containing protein [Candidatus Ranarchaeia archaeon]
MNEDNMKKEIEELKKQMKEIQNEIKKESQSTKEKVYKIKTNIVDPVNKLQGSISKYVSGVMDSVASSLETSFSGIFPNDPGKGSRKLKIRIDNLSIDKKYLSHFYKESSNLLSLIADENRLKLLKELENSGKYQKELSENTKIHGGTFNHHINKLIESNFAIQEAVRGRYLITIEGREALKLAEFLYLRKFPKHCCNPKEVQEDKDKPTNIEIDPLDENED